MEGGLSPQTKISLIKNEREERSLQARVQRIALAKSLWAHNSDSDRKLFLKSHSHILTRALGVSKCQVEGKAGLSPSPRLCRREKVKSPRPALNKTVPPEELSAMRSEPACDGHLAESSGSSEHGRSSAGKPTPEVPLTLEDRPSQVQTPSKDAVIESVLTEFPDSQASRGELSNSRETKEHFSSKEVVLESGSEAEYFHVNDTQSGDPTGVSMVNSVTRDVGDTKRIQEDSLTFVSQSDYTVLGVEEGSKISGSDHMNRSPELESCTAASNIETGNNNSGQKHQRSSDASSPPVLINLGAHETPTKHKLELDELPVALQKGQTFVTELGQIAEEDPDVVPQDETRRKPIPLLLSEVNLPTPKRYTPSLVKPTLSPIKDEFEENDGMRRDVTTSEHQSPHGENSPSNNSLPSEGEADKEPVPELGHPGPEQGPGPEVDSVDGCIEQVRISNAFSDDDVSDNTNFTTEDVTSVRCDGEVKGPTEHRRKKKSAMHKKTKHKTETKSKRKHKARPLALILTAPVSGQHRQKQQKPICKRYEDAVIPAVFNIDYIKRIIKKNAPKGDDSDSDNDAPNEYGMSLYRKKLKKKVHPMSPVLPRVTWTREKLATLPECRYLRLPPLAQLGQVL